jgi:hypothetical protein
MPQSIRAMRRQARAALILLASVAIVTGNLLSVHAAPLTDASLELSDPRTSQTADYTLDANSFSTGIGIACVVLDLGAASDGTGAVSGLDTSSASFDSTNLLTFGDWAVDNTASANHELRITHTSSTETPSATGNIVWGGIVNGDTEGTTYYGVVTTYTNSNCSTGPTDSVTLAFVYRDGELVQLTIDPSLSFTTNSVASGTSVNGSPNTTVTSGATGIDFGNAVTSSLNGVSAHRLDVTTNASGGYNVYIRHTGDLENTATDTITAHTGTNGTPTAFPAAGTEAWGYTTDDADLTQFTSNTWAGFTTSNEVVMTNAAASAGTDQVNVAHQVGVAATTEAGTYQTTIVYTIVATY